MPRPLRQRPVAVRRALLLVLVAVAAVLLLLATSTDLTERIVGVDEEAPVLEAEDVKPPGFWHRVQEIGSDPASAEERARLISLPYLGGRLQARAGAELGVTRLDRERVQPGVNLYVSGHAPEAILMDLDGRVLHRWRKPFGRVFPDVRPTNDTQFFRRAHLFEDGALLALYQTGGLVFLDRDSEILGRCRGNFYNDFWVGQEGRIWTIAKEVASEDGQGARLDDFLVELRHDGRGESCREARRLSITGAFERSRYARLLDRRAPTGDVLHTNTVAELDGTERPADPAFAEGNLLISLREVDVVAVVDPAAGEVTWARRGPWRAQHEPTLLASGEILLFDNQGAPGGRSRLLDLDPATGEITWSWSGRPPENLSSAIGGSCARLPNGNTLVTESLPGRAFELDPDERIVWEFLSPHRTGFEDPLVAMLFEVLRLPREPWMDEAP